MTREIPLGTLSHGTMRSEDLIPIFYSFLKRHATFEARGAFWSAWSDARLEIESGDIVAWIEESQERADYLLEDLFEELDLMAPEGFYFGAHPGDGSDYGFWKVEEDC